VTYSSKIQTLFAGPSVTSTYPPHNGLAVGPNNIVMVEGSRIEWTNLIGGSPKLQSTYNFFASLSPTGGLYDQRVMYDSVNQRYIVIMEYGASGNTISSIDIAVSKDSNPNDGWYFASLNTSLTINGHLSASDRPMLAIDGSNIYITAPMYGVNVSSSDGTESWVISDTAGSGGGIYNGGALTVAANELVPASQGIFAVAAGNNGKIYYAGDSSSGGQIAVALQTYDATTNTFGPTSAISLGNIDQGGNYTAQQLGTSLLLEAGDRRIASLVYANGFLYAVAEMRPIGSSVPLVHWFKVDVSNPNAPSLVAQGDISGATIGSNVATFNPSIAVDASGDVIINFTASGPNMYPGDYYVFQGGSDPIGSFSAPILYQASTGFFNSGDGSSVQRWGVNSTAIVDPNNPNSFWISNEYVASGWWQTSVAQIAVQNSGTAATTVSSIAISGAGVTNGSGDLNAGQVVTLIVSFSGAVTVNTAGGTPTLVLNDGGTATYTGGSGSSALTFSYTVAAGQNTPDLVVSSFNLNGATVKDGAGNAANLSGATNYNPTGTLQIDTVAPTVASIAASGTGITNGTGKLAAGQAATLTVNFSEPVTVNTAGGTPTLALNDGATATYTGGSGSSALTFSYTVAAGQNTPDLVVSSFNLNGATVKDGAGNAANLSGATNNNPTGTLQIDTVAPTVASIAASGTGITNGTGNLVAGQVATLTVNFSEPVTVNTAGGTPTLVLNDGGAATYTSGSGSSALIFSYTVAAGQNTPDLVVSSLNLNGATVKDGAGNAANLSGATNYNPAGTLQIDTVAPTIASIAASGTEITNGTGNLAAGQAVTLTVNFSEAVTVNTAGGTPTLALNDGGTATYTGGSGSSALNFSYTVAAGQNTPDLVVSSLNLNGATVKDGAGNAANLSGATNYNPTGILQINTALSGVPPYSRIVVVIEENKNYNEIAGNSQAPYINSLMANGASLTNFTAVAHPSEPNYYALYAGSTFGITDDNAHSLPDPTLYTVLQNAGLTFTGYVDDAGTGNVGNHEPWVSFPEGRSVQTDFISFPALFPNGNYSTLPNVSFVIPNPVDDMHDGTIAQGDAWLQQNLGAYAQWAITNNSLLVVTWDENDNEAINQIPTLLYGANIVPGNYGAAYNQYNVLSTILASFGLTGPNNAATAAPIQVFGSGAALVSSITASGPGITNGSGDLNAGQAVTLTVNFSGAVTVNTAGGTPTLVLNDGGIATYTSGSGSSALTLSYAVAAGQNTPDLVVSSFNLNGATVKDGAGNNADLSGATNYNPTGTLQIDTVAPTIASIATSGTGITNGTGNIAAGQVVTLTVNFSEPVTVNTAGGTPALALNDGGAATYTGGSGSSALTFSYTVAAGQNTPDLVVSSLNLNGATVKDGAGNAANLSGATNYNPAGILQIGTTSTTVSSIATSGTGITNGSGDLNASHVVTLTVNFSGAVTVDTTTGAPTLTLNDGAAATYSGGSGSSALTFSYTVAAGQNTPDLVVSSFNLNGATVKDGAGNNATLSGATNYNPSGTLQIDTTAPVPAFNQEPPPVTSSSTAVFALTTSNSETNGVSYAYELDGATTWTPMAGATLSLAGLANGSHAIQVQATDGAGNVSTTPATYNWTIAAPIAQVEKQFSGPSVTGTSPPNNGLAVGSNNVVMMEASRIEWTNLAGGSPIVQSVYNFFSPLGATAANSLNHPRAAYDSINQRYIVIMDNTASGHSISNIDIAVSRDSNPNDGWYFASLNTSLTINGQLTSADSPTLSVDGKNVYITATMYNVNVSGSPGSQSWVISDTAGAGGGLYNGGALTVTASGLIPASQGVFAVATGGNAKTYYASAYSSGSQMVVSLQTYDATINTFGPTSTVGLGNIDQGGSYTAQQLGTSLLLNAGSKQARSPVYQNGFLYGVTEIKPAGSSVPLVHWFKIDVSNPSAPTLATQGDISGAPIGTNVATFNPSIAVDASGDVIINFTASGPNMYPGDYYVYQRGSDPAGSFSAPILYQASTSFFNTGSAGVQPWGNYSTAIVDPNNSNSFWISNEYVANNWWQTSVAQVTIESAEPPTLTIANSSLNVAAGGSVQLGITATPVDSDDALSVKIAGVPTYESITAPNGYAVTSSLQTDGTNTWTVTESGSTVGTSLSGLTLFSSYTGSDQPAASFTVTASNTTSGEAATSAPLALTVIDPPVVASNGGSSVGPSLAASLQDSGHIDHVLALMDQFTAAGFQQNQTGLDTIASTPGSNGVREHLALLAMPTHLQSWAHS
jgi:hypothetical protein